MISPITGELYGLLSAVYIRLMKTNRLPPRPAAVRLREISPTASESYIITSVAILSFPLPFLLYLFLPFPFFSFFRLTTLGRMTFQFCQSRLKIPRYFLENSLGGVSIALLSRRVPLRAQVYRAFTGVRLLFRRTVKDRTEIYERTSPVIYNLFTFRIDSANSRY